MDINDKITPADEERLQIDLTNIQTDVEADSVIEEATKSESKTENKHNGFLFNIIKNNLFKIHNGNFR